MNEQQTIRLHAVRENMKNMIVYAQKEYERYKETKDPVLLQQAGEKLFNAFENYIQFKEQITVDSFYEIKLLVKEKQLRRLLYDARHLHRFFYNYTNEMDVDDAEELFHSVHKRLTERVKAIA